MLTQRLTRRTTYAKRLDGKDERVVGKTLWMVVSKQGRYISQGCHGQLPVARSGCFEITSAVYRAGHRRQQQQQHHL